MSDYVYVPKVEDESSVFTNGLAIISRDGIGDYKIGYVADNPIGITVGLYQSNNNLYFVVTTGRVVNDAIIYLVNPYSTTLFEINSISTPYEDGYYAEDSYTIVPTSTACTVFNSLTETLQAMVDPTPSPTSGVVVTVKASPNYTPPTTDGVVVTIIGRLLDPNQQGGTSTTGGGQGTFDDTSDVVPIPPMPLLSASGCGLVTLFRPSLSELQALGSYLWTNITDFIENLNKLFMNPMDYIISLNIFPCNPSVNPSRPIHIGSVTTSISMSPVSSQWYEFDCGTINIREYWGSALDYAPNTKISLFLPFIGSVQINTDEVMGKIMGIKYRIDLLSGQCVAMVTVGDSPTTVGTVYYQYTGECAVSVPLTGADWSRIYSAAIGAIGTAITGGIAAGASGAAAGGATAALAGARASEAMSTAGQNFAMLNETSKGVRGVQEMRNRMLEAAEIASNAARQAAASPSQVGNAIKTSRIANTISNTVGQVISGKGHISHTGTISGSAGMLGVKVPYLILEFPSQSLADNYKHFVGYPSNLSGKLGDFMGYTECEQVIPAGFTGTDDELAELLDALKGGVYL